MSPGPSVGRRLPIAILLAAVLAPSGNARQEQRATFATAAQPFLTRHCTECHSEAVRKRKLRLDGPAPDFGKDKTFETWVKVYDKIEAREMPPPKSPQPSPQDVAAVLQWLGGELHRASLARRSKEGRAVVRRLNRVEHENTLRDLLALPGLDVKSMLPEDGKAHGFTKLGETLDLSHVQISKYMEVADLALDRAVAIRALKPPPYQPAVSPTWGLHELFGRGEVVFLKGKRYDHDTIPIPGSLKNLAETDRIYAEREPRIFPYTGSVGILRGEDDAFRPTFWTHDRQQVRAPAAGWYRIRLSIWSFLWDKGEVKSLAKPQPFLLRNGPRTLGLLDAPSLEPKVHELRVWLEPDQPIGFNPLTIPYRPIGHPGLASTYVGPGVAIDSLEVVGPETERWPPESHRRLFGDLKIERFVSEGKVRIQPPPRHGRPQNEELCTVVSRNPGGDARRLLGTFLKRAFRRPPSETELSRYLGIFQRRLNGQASFEEAMRTACKAALCSAHFLFLQQAPGPLDSWALASRLSYFLWNSMPDDELLAAAAGGQLSRPEALRAQVERMLQDPKSERFVEDFTDQWLELREIDATAPDSGLYPEFNQYLRLCMLEEPRAYLREMLRSDRPVVEIVQSDWSMLNQGLAEFYGIPDVRGAEFRRVQVPPSSHRGGFLTQAAILKVTANGTTTSPVKRGSFVLDKILNRPPEPPPPDISAIEPDLRGGTTIREQLAAHRSRPECGSCHAKIDPAGFALENFDVIGGWRTAYRALGRRSGRAVDPAGQLPDGTPFRNIDEFKPLLAKNPDAILRGLAEKLVIYATGAGLDFADRAAVEDILRRVREKGSGLRTLVHEVVQSPLFRQK